jgi:hypothetical protein
MDFFLHNLQQHSVSFFAGALFIWKTTIRRKINLEKPPEKLSGKNILNGVKIKEISSQISKLECPSSK